MVTRPTQSALLPSLSRTPEELTASNGAAGVVEGAGVLVGPLLAAVILTTGSPAAVFAAGAVLTLLAAILVVGLRPVAGRLPSDASADDDGADTEDGRS